MKPKTTLPLPPLRFTAHWEDPADAALLVERALVLRAESVGRNPELLLTFTCSLVKDYDATYLRERTLLLRSWNLNGVALGSGRLPHPAALEEALQRQGGLDPLAATLLTHFLTDALREAVPMAEGLVSAGHTRRPRSIARQRWSQLQEWCRRAERTLPPDLLA